MRPAREELRLVAEAPARRHHGEEGLHVEQAREGTGVA